MFPVDLLLRDDDLARANVACVGDRVIQDTDDSDHLTHFGDTFRCVAGVADQLLASGNLWRAK